MPLDDIKFQNGLSDDRFHEYDGTGAVCVAAVTHMPDGACQFVLRPRRRAPSPSTAFVKHDQRNLADFQYRRNEPLGMFDRMTGMSLRTGPISNGPPVQPSDEYRDYGQALTSWNAS